MNDELKAIEELKEIRAIFVAAKTEEDAIKAGTLLLMPEFRRRYIENDTFPRYFMLKHDNNKYYSLAYLDGKLDIINTDGTYSPFDYDYFKD